MILRKPYAFLIKYFRIIHLVLTTLIGILLYNTKQLLDFFNSYIDEGIYSILSGVSEKYVPSYLYLVIFLILALCFTIIFLLKIKDKPIKYYVINSLIYFVLLFILSFSKSQLTGIEFNEINIILLRITRDILLIIYIAQYIIMFFSVFRTLGFDIKKFNFKKDIVELDITTEDNEEFELDVAVDSEDVKSRIRKSVRNIKYFYRENRMVILLLAFILVSIGGFNAYKTFVDNKVYLEKQQFSSYNFEMEILESYQLTTDYRGNEIINDSLFVVLKIKFKNITNQARTINTNNMILRCNDLITYTPTDKYYDYFIDLGDGYKGQTIPSGAQREYIFVYKVDNKYLNNNKTFEYIKSVQKVDNENVYDLIKVRLSFNRIGEPKLISLKSLGNTLEFNDYLLGNSKIIIHNYEISKSFIHEYKYCDDDCQTRYEYIVPLSSTKYDASVLKLNVSFAKDGDIQNSNINTNILSSFTKLRYVINGEEVTQKFMLNNLTPENEDDYVYLEVNSNISKATSIYLDFYLRNFKYTYVLRDK